jgi:hypothetical protein
LQPLNADDPIDVSAFGNVTEDNDLQFSNVDDSIDLTLSLMTTLVRFTQSLNAEPSISVTEFGIVTEVNP